MVDGSGSRGLDRRGFLKGVSLVAAGGAAALPVVLASAEEKGAAPPDPFRGPGPVPFSLDVDGTRRDLHEEPRTTLLEALRGSLGVTAPKEVCDAGACGACTVLLDGVPALACMTLAIECEGRSVVTAAGLAAAGGAAAHLPEAFRRHDALQCGFCTPGMVTSCAALLAAEPDPSEERIREAISGNLCRCGTYPNVVRACRDAAKAAGEKR